MTRRLPVQEIRGSDPTLLEVKLSEILRRPLGQIAPLNVMDLIELASTEACPRSLERKLQDFTEGVARQIADIPSGRSWEEYLEELEDLEGTRVPLRFREILGGQSGRSERASERIEALLQRWSESEPEPFELNTHRAKVMRVEAAPPRRRGASEPSSGPRERRRSGGARARTGSGRAQTPVDTERRSFIRELCLEKLARASENGLGEKVLVAGIRHQARDRYPDLLPAEITVVLRDLKDAHQVRYSAGRWSLPTRF
ncbi:MAG TPA: hypothetical protein ENK18_05710 [Deltaproteobacteria bacterium]|nr:hypothetical protein [Deltaproteobacteria bacterium]